MDGQREGWMDGGREGEREIVYEGRIRGSLPRLFPGPVPPLRESESERVCVFIRRERGRARNDAPLKLRMLLHHGA